MCKYSTDKTQCDNASSGGALDGTENVYLSLFAKANFPRITKCQCLFDKLPVEVNYMMQIYKNQTMKCGSTGVFPLLSVIHSTLAVGLQRIGWSHCTGSPLCFQLSNDINSEGIIHTPINGNSERTSGRAYTCSENLLLHYQSNNLTLNGGNVRWGITRKALLMASYQHCDSLWNQAVNKNVKVKEKKELFQIQKVRIHFGLKIWLTAPGEKSSDGEQTEKGMLKTDTITNGKVEQPDGSSSEKNSSICVTFSIPLTPTHADELWFQSNSRVSLYSQKEKEDLWHLRD
ncbi:hypothetical protein UY3_16299 [Chelonia mydas]|uniref:Uncharacterized protein n=1 Tax=Chelonia mydas TaxID=8469 RepID=M7B3C5_CHEMY|nr:hypothetical protein UY3_16299 [Chelonia mydas]